MKGNDGHSKTTDLPGPRGPTAWDAMVAGQSKERRTSWFAKLNLNPSRAPRSLPRITWPALRNAQVRAGTEEYEEGTELVGQHRILHHVRRRRAGQGERALRTTPRTAPRPGRLSAQPPARS